MPWPEVAISEVADVIRGVTYSKEESGCTAKQGYTPILRSTNIQDSRLHLESDLVFVPDSNVSPTQKLRSGDIVLATSSGSKHLVGKSGLIQTDWPGSFGAFCAVIRPKAAVVPRYLAAFLQSPGYWKQVGKKALGVNINNLRRGDIESLRFPLPTLPEQNKIVGEIDKQFSRLDEATANLRRAKANLHRHEAAIFRAAFEGKMADREAVIAARESRPFETGEQLLQRVTGARRKTTSRRMNAGAQLSSGGLDDLPPIPLGWTWARLEDVAEIKGGITVDAKRVDSTARRVPYLRVANVQRGYLDLSAVKEIDASEADIYELRLEHGDVLFNEGGDRDKLGRGWVWEGQIGECIHQNHVFRARLLSKDLSPKLVSWWGNTFGKQYFSKQGKQTTNLASINLSKLRSFPVPIPPALEQQRIVAEVERHLSIVREVEAEVDANLKRAQALRQAILAKAFAG